ncbi:MAG: hypothetical protein ACRERC_05590 [Candidatus Binatia bacterium]
MPKAIRKKARRAEPGQRQVNVRLDTRLYRTLESVARQERRTVPQVVRLLLEDALLQRVRGGQVSEDTPAWEVARLASAGGGFDWLEDEPDLYDDRAGEPL